MPVAMPPDWNRRIDQLFDAVGRDQDLAQTLAVFAHDFAARSLVLFTTPTNAAGGGPTTTAGWGISPRVLLEYQSHFFAHDDWLRAASARAPLAVGTVLVGSELVPHAQLVRGYFWRQFLKPNGVADVLSTVLEAPESDASITYFSLHRGIDDPAFGPADKALMAELQPHVRRALRLHRRLAPRLALGATLQDLFHAAPTPMLIVRGDGAPLMRNAPAAMLLADAKTLRLGRGERLEWRDGTRWLPLAGLLEDVASHRGKTTVRVASDRNGMLYRLSVRSAHATPAGTPQQPADAAMVCAVEALLGTDPATLRLRFGLTSAEAEVGTRLAAGMTVAQVADQLGVATSTVRTHLDGLFSKTGTRRQTALLARLLGAARAEGEAGPAPAPEDGH